MKFAAILTFAGLATALPSWHGWYGGNGGNNGGACLTEDRAAYIVSRARIYQLKANLGDARAAGEELYGPDFRQYSDSVNSLRGDPLGTLVEPDGATYINNTLSAPPLQAINTLAILNNCTHIFWQWSFIGVGGPAAPNPRINGFVLIGTDPARDVQPVISQYVEFNSYAWAENSGFTITFPDEGTYSPDSRRA